MSMPEAQFLEGGAIVFRVPFRREWVDRVKASVPADHREWNPDDKFWIVWPPFAADVLRLTKNTFGFLSERGNPAAMADDHFRILHLRETAPIELIETAFRTLAKIHHPDRGGDHATMRQLVSSYEALRERVAS
jgi:hypothetical protein